MALFDPNAPPDSARRALIGRPSLRRELRALPAGRENALAAGAAAQYDPQRFKGAFRDTLQRSIETEQTASRLNQRDALAGLLRDPRLTPEQRDAANARLRQLPNPNSVEARFDPRSPNSVAYRQFGTLYRDV